MISDHTLAPCRIQRKRTKGWRMPPNTVYVGRPSKWGNPYRVDDFLAAWGTIEDRRARAQACVDHYRFIATEGGILIPMTCLEPHERDDGLRSFGAHAVRDVATKYLRGKNLACWCPLDQPCHADVLLELANR